MNQQVLKGFLRPIVEEFMQNEIDAFDIGSDIKISDVYTGRDPRQERKKKTVSEFGGTVAEVMEFVLLIWGTYKAASEAKEIFIEMKQGDDEARIEGLAKNWTAVLEQAGLDREKAVDISQKFSTQLIDLIKDNS